MSALDDWRDALTAMAIPEQVVAAAPESPWGYPTELFRHRVSATLREPSALVERALEALPHGGTILDVGVGGGATSLPLAGRASRIVGVDASEGMLASFTASAAEAGVDAVAIRGSWPDVAREVGPADVVVAGHVLYNVGELEPFVLALTEHARRRVVIEITTTHPLAWMTDLWPRFHGFDRSPGPTADDAEAALREIGLDMGREDRELEPRSGGFERREDAIALVRRRLCLSPDRDAEVAEALGDLLAERGGLWSAGPLTQRIVTMWWAGTFR
jgi:precorrin-6B methylase 2